VLATHLEDEPCQLQMAANGREALDRMQQFTPDLILLDLMMPVMDGMTFLKEIRAIPRFQWVPVVVVTSRDLSAEEVAQLRHTTQEIVKKGDVFEADLKGILHRLLQTRRPHPPTPTS
jgi:CheY-like chemotaxis protein